MKIRPLGDNIIVKPKKEEETSATGIVLSTNNDEQTLTGEVLAVGKDANDIKVGDFVVYAPFSGKEIGGKLIIGSHDIMGIIEK
jgi:chaperonin GroES